MECKSCGSDKQSKFTAEMAIHFPGLKNISKPHVWVYPELLVCLNCGNTEFVIPETELRVLARADAAAAGGS
jgi:hypothetical protein